jgi:adenylate cyclase
MMEQDEEGTLRRLKALQGELIEPRVREHHGRIVKTTGDGFLIEFGSPLEAVRCALEVQETMNANGAPESSRGSLRLRIGINLGDIIIENDGDIYGDGVNVATRLEQIAEPGSVCISWKVFDEIEGKLPTTFVFTGDQAVKNLTRPVRVYAAMPGNEMKAAFEKLPLPDKPSIAVLPFTNMSGDPDQDYFADGITEELITALSRVGAKFRYGSRKVSAAPANRPFSSGILERSLGSFARSE